MPKRAQNKRVRRTYRELFLDQLAELSNGEPTPVGNIALRDALGWDEDRYARIKAQLKDEGLVAVGTGKGGSVRLQKGSAVDALRVFISYSHVDESLKNELVRHLEPLRTLKLIEDWHDGMVKPGDDWDNAITKSLERANIVLLLVSIDFLNSYYCVEVELEKSIERQARGELQIIPIILRSCLWRLMPFHRLKALPKDAKAITTWLDRDEAFTNVAEGLLAIARGELITESAT